MLVLTRKQGTSVVIRIPPSSQAREVRIIVDRIIKSTEGNASARMVFKSDDRDIVILRNELSQGGGDVC